MATARNNDKDFVCCMSCSNGIFMQWFDNPVIAYCRVRKERMVAESRRICQTYTPSSEENPEIRHFDCYAEDQLSFLRLMKK